ncbi:MAG: choice-of-anchor J domain-containing protein, partial [Bacteroidales bacterium]|nr:choice-of-anchor J domain-containing protein [Bacteroidales bacterium]
YLKCTGLYIGRYQGLPQLGFRYKDDNGSVGLGRIPDEVFMQNTIRDGVAPVVSADMPQPIEITDANQLSDKYYNQLLLLRNVEFAPDDIGQEFSPAPPTGSNPTSSNRIFTINGTGSELTLRTSSACRFFRRPVPAGKGDMLCIYAIYGTTQQFYLRQLSDLNLEQFDSTASLSRTLFYESFSSRDHSFTIYDVEGPAEWTYGTYGNGCMMVQGNSSNNTKNEDWLFSPAFTLDGDFNYYDLNFQYVLRYKSNSASDYTVRVLEGYEDGMNPYDADDWANLSVSLVQSSDWSFRTSPNIDLSEYKGKTIRIAFVYKSDEEYMATWELNNVKVIGHQE